MKQLRSYQHEARFRFKDAPFFCLNFDCGVGKTITAATIAQDKELPTIIIAPNALVDQWRDELVEMGVDPEDIFVASKPAERKNPESYKAKFLAFLGRK